LAARSRAEKEAEAKDGCRTPRDQASCVGNPTPQSHFFWPKRPERLHPLTPPDGGERETDMSDNFKIDIAWKGPLLKAMEIAFSNWPGAKSYIIDPKKGLIFCWTDTDSAHALVQFPFKMDAKGAADFAERWLAEQEYGREPDHDGSNGKGWRIYNDQWSRVDGYTYSICAVQPCWMMYGK
jgi:hypothetical protein